MFAIQTSRGAIGAFALLLLAGLAADIKAQELAPDDELLRQRERDRALQERLETRPDVRLSVPQETVGRFPDQESPCFIIDALAWQGEALQRFGWLDAAVVNSDGQDSPIGRCLGTQGINLVLERAQNALVERGYVTSRVLVEPQDLSDGTLTITLLPGRIASLRVADAERSHASLRNAVPAGSGDILNLRDIEQALENFQRVPSADVDIQIAPGETPNHSDLVVDYHQGRPLRPAWSVDDSGSDATGRYQSGVTVAYDNLLGINDLFYVHLGKDLGGGDAGSNGNRSRTVHYSVPWGYWSLGATYSDYDYHQTVAGAFEDIVYEGSSRNTKVNLSRVIHRDASRKTTASLGGFQNRSRTHIDGQEVLVQRRQVGGWEAGIEHREFLGPATLDSTLFYQRGTGAFGSLPAPGEAFGEGTSRFQIVTADAELKVPFTVGEQPLRYLGQWRWQRNLTPLAPLERFSIGGRYTVRGFNDTGLSADRGWLVRNELEIPLGGSGQALYAGLDYGRVGGPSSEWLLGKELGGVALGLRGNLLHFVNYDVFVAAPVIQPDGFRSDSHDLGFSVHIAF
ncbi:ShlB/FhaC/HecB family hemolysin secretion/activation protein [Franzmannia pantelleriensis]|uniref:ShlB/FhaC/HecB family hemolysin secretion/activation protein n=1 Tax=Franzmannia pantelleriensis TaxID=48727 RepID=UPI001C40ACC6|nr:ShlB/FhaC/HecB family hemolysin secretion/activation protein [Halomonas pantelleriensis]